MTIHEDKAIATFKAVLNSWGKRDLHSLNESMNHLANSCNGFGSGQNEFWKDKAAYLIYCKESNSFNAESFDLKYKWIKTNHLSANIVGLCSEISIRIQLPNKNILIDPIRITSVFQTTSEKTKLLQWHISRPDATTEEEMWEGTGAPTSYESVSILFTDFVGFSNIVSKISPKKLVEELNEIFAQFDHICRNNRVEKIKTIGDAYMAATGLNQEKNHAHLITKTAKEMLDYLHERNQQNDLIWNMRIGIHSGPVVGGTIGSEKIGFDLWGDTVNIASRMETASQANRINVSKSTYQLISNKYNCSYRGKIEIKDKRQLDMYFVD